MQDKPKILVIDDDKVALKSIEKSLSEFYQVETAQSGEAGIARARSLEPDFILLDVEMAGMNGYEVCYALRQDEATRTTPILFLSGRDKLEEKIRGYEAGGDDFIVKPCAAEELIAKLLVLSRFHTQTRALAEKVQSATAAAMTALTGSSEMGMAMTFVEQSYVTADFDSLADAFLRVCDAFGLRVCLALLPSTGHRFYSSSGPVAPLESELILRLRGGDRFVDFGCRTVINYSTAVMLIKNMPLDDSGRYGRLKDLLPSMMGAVDARVKGIDTEQALRKQSRDLALGVQAVESTLRGMSEQLRREQHMVTNVMRHLLDDLEAAIPAMGLDEDQERYLVHRIDQAVEDATQIVNEGARIGGAFDTVLRLLDHITERQAQIMERIAEPLASRAEDKRSAGAELF